MDFYTIFFHHLLEQLFCNPGMKVVPASHKNARHYTSLPYPSVRVGHFPIPERSRRRVRDGYVCDDRFSSDPESRYDSSPLSERSRGEERSIRINPEGFDAKTLAEMSRIYRGDLVRSEHAWKGWEIRSPGGDHDNETVIKLVSEDYSKLQLTSASYEVVKCDWNAKIKESVAPDGLCPTCGTPLWGVSSPGRYLEHPDYGMCLQYCPVTREPGFVKVDDAHRFFENRHEALIIMSKDAQIRVIQEYRDVKRMKKYVDFILGFDDENKLYVDRYDPLPDLCLNPGDIGLVLEGYRFICEPRASDPVPVYA